MHSKRRRRRRRRNIKNQKILIPSSSSSSSSPCHVDFPIPLFKLLTIHSSVVAGRNLRSDGKVEQAYCTIDLAGNKRARTTAINNKEPMWNESFNLYVYFIPSFIPFLYWFMIYI